MPPVPGEVYIMCNDCGARIRSGDSLDMSKGTYKGINCPYKYPDGNCLTPEERKKFGQ